MFIPNFYPTFRSDKRRVTIVFHNKDNSLSSVRATAKKGDPYNPLIGFFLAYFKMVKRVNGMSADAVQAYIDQMFFYMPPEEQIAYLSCFYYETQEHISYATFNNMREDVVSFWEHVKDPLLYVRPPRYFQLKFMEGFPQIDLTLSHNFVSSVLVSESQMKILIKRYDNPIAVTERIVNDIDYQQIRIKNGYIAVPWNHREFIIAYLEDKIKCLDISIPPRFYTPSYIRNLDMDRSKKQVLMEHVRMLKRILAYECISES